MAEPYKIRGPFRALFIPFQDNINEILESIIKITFSNQHFECCIKNNDNIILYFTTPYETAKILQSHEKLINISLYNDVLSETLNPCILYIKTENMKSLITTVTELDGTIILKNEYSIQAKFSNFIKTAEAHKILNTNHEVKFAYKSESPKIILRSNEDLRNIIQNKNENTNTKNHDLRNGLKRKIRKSNNHYSKFPRLPQ